jgi:hypothetical protein
MIVLRGEEAGGACEGGGKGDVVGGAVVVDVVGADDGAGELLEEVIFLVGGAVGADDADAVGTLGVAQLAEACAGEGECLFPGDWLEAAVGLAEQWGREALDAVGEVEAVAAFVAEEVAVHAALVAVVAANDFGAVGDGADTEGGLAAIAAMGADGGDVVHLPGAGFIAIGTRGESSYGAGVDAHAALLAVERGHAVGRFADRDVGCDDG